MKIILDALIATCSFVVTLEVGVSYPNELLAWAIDNDELRGLPEINDIVFAHDSVLRKLE